jgi:hypothetical protein
MSARRTLAVLAAGAAAALALATGGGAATTDDVSITVSRSHVATELGNKFSFQTEITNETGVETTSLIAHLNVLSLEKGVYVDPEDWSADRTRYIGTLASNESETINWNIHAVNDGRFAAYITVLPQTVTDEVPTTGPVVEFDVKKKTTLNAGGILPLALGVPAALGLLALGIRVTRRRR